ncbi:MAG: pyridoxamine 5'-phosphate oxidase [Serratia sp.]|nr:pyridoxamine 5'-phosphate oxidase [Serratia sp. (in: enterobacteria)]
MNNPFHAGERQAQALAGFDVVAHGIREAMPEQHQLFFTALPYLFISTLDEDGWPVATLLCGPAGFIRVPDDGHLRVNAPRRADDPALAVLQTGKQIGALGIDFSNRRRNRVNGRIGRMDKNRIEIVVDQSFGNCPQYIQIRKLTDVPVSRPLAPREDMTMPDDEARALIARADTFFIASHAPDGADVSHRGGQPGFAHLVGNRLWIPDYRGNKYMNTLGNLLAEPRAALLFIDFDNGDVLHIQGTTQIHWQPDEISVPAGTERYWTLDITRLWRFRSALPWRADAVEYSSATLSTGHWQRESES